MVLHKIPDLHFLCPCVGSVNRGTLYIFTVMLSGFGQHWICVIRGDLHHRLWYHSYRPYWYECNQIRILREFQGGPIWCDHPRGWCLVCGKAWQCGLYLVWNLFFQPYNRHINVSIMCMHCWWYRYVKYIRHLPEGICLVIYQCVEGCVRYMIKECVRQICHRMCCCIHLWQFWEGCSVHK